MNTDLKAMSEGGSQTEPGCGSPKQAALRSMTEAMTGVEAPVEAPADELVEDEPSDDEAADDSDDLL